MHRINCNLTEASSNGVRTGIQSVIKSSQALRLEPVLARPGQFWRPWQSR